MALLAACLCDSGSREGRGWMCPRDRACSFLCRPSRSPAGGRHLSVVAGEAQMREIVCRRVRENFCGWVTGEGFVEDAKRKLRGLVWTVE
eukprot:4624345-Prymnesium_polylepis.1